MGKLRTKGNIAAQDFMIHIVNNLSEDNIILDWLKKCPTLIGPDSLMAEVISDELNHIHEKNKNKNNNRKEKKNCQPMTNNYKQVQKCGENGHNLSELKCLENKNESRNNTDSDRKKNVLG